MRRAPPVRTGTELVTATRPVPRLAGFRNDGVEKGLVNKAPRCRTARDQSVACVPSHNGLLPVRLQPQK